MSALFSCGQRANNVSVFSPAVSVVDGMLPAVWHSARILNREGRTERFELVTYHARMENHATRSFGGIHCLHIFLHYILRLCGDAKARTAIHRTGRSRACPAFGYTRYAGKAKAERWT